MTFLPFLPEFHDKLRAGLKVATARTKQYGEAGDVLASPVGPLRLVRVRQRRLDDIAENSWREEGCASPAHFIEVWNRIHPRRGYRGDDVVWFHLFEVVA